MEKLALQIKGSLNGDLWVRVLDGNVVNFSAPLTRRLTKKDVQDVRTALAALGYAEIKSWTGVRAGVFSASIKVNKS